MTTQHQEQRENKTGNILGIAPARTVDGKPAVSLATRRLKVNTDPTVRESPSTPGNYFVTFMTNVWGEFAIKRVKEGMNNPTKLVEDPKFGLSMRVSIYCRDKAAADYYMESLVKGTTVEQAFGKLTFNEKYGLELNTNAWDLNLATDKIQYTVLGLARIQTGDGTPIAVMGTRELRVNTDARMTDANTQGRYFVSFLTSVWDARSIKRLKGIMNNPIGLVEDEKFGLSLKVSIACQSKSQADFYATAIKKGARINGIFSNKVTYSPEYGLQVRVQGGDLGFITRADGSAPAQEAESRQPATGEATPTEVASDEEFVI